MRLFVLWALAACSVPTEKLGPEPVSAETTATTVTSTGSDGTTELPDPESGAVLFDEDVAVWPVRLEMSVEAINALLEDDAIWVAADLTVNGETYEQVGVTLKGNGSFQPLDEKPSFKISTDRFVPDQEVDGIDAFVLNNMVGDSSMIAERMAYRFYRDAGVPAPRAVHASVQLNDRAYGLYTLVESVDGQFLNRWFEDGDGSLYEMFDVDFLAEDIWHFDHDGGPDNRDPLFEIAAALEEGGRLTDVAEHLIDIDAFARYFAVSSFVGQFDAYPYSFPGDDLFLYVDPLDGRVRFVPHGADETFVDSDRPADYVYGILGHACLDDPACDEVWRQEIHRVGDLSEEGDYPSQAFWLSQDVSAEAILDTRKPYSDALVDLSQGQLQNFIYARSSALDGMLGL